MKNIFIFSIALIVVSCNQQNPPVTLATRVDSTKIFVAKKEKENPADFLKADGDYRKNLAGRWVVEGNITNTATQTVYKDVVVKVFYYDKAKKEIGSEVLTVNDYFQPKEPKPFKVKSYGAFGAKSVGFKIISAKTFNEN